MADCFIVEWAIPYIELTLTKIFIPRLGGVVVITTKSKKFLKPLIEEYNKRLEEGQKNRIPGELLIR